MNLWRLSLTTILLAGTLSNSPALAAVGGNDGVQMTDAQMKELIRMAADKDEENDRRQRDYTFIQREEEHHLDGKGNVKSTESRTYEVLVLYGEPVQKLIAKDDKSLSQQEAAKEDAKIQKVMDDRSKENEDQRRKRIAKEEKDREEDRAFVREIADAYDFKFAGAEPVNGRQTWVIHADPKPGYEPHQKNAKFLPEFKFTVWVDQQEKQWVKLDIECIDTVSVGLFLVRLHKGSNIQVEQTRVNDEVWLPRHVSLKVDARVALLKGLNISEDVTYREYKKFRAGTRIVPGSEVEGPAKEPVP